MDMTRWEAVADMLGCKWTEIPKGLVDRILRVDALAGYAGGEIGSRQVLAVIVDQWQREQREEAVQDSRDTINMRDGDDGNSSSS